MTRIAGSLGAKAHQGFGLAARLRLATRPQAKDETSKRKRGRKPLVALASGFGAFLVLQLGLAVAIEWRLPELRDPDHANKASKLRERTLEAPVKPVSAVMFGSSRVAYGLRGQFIESTLAEAAGKPAVVFNFGINGCGPLAQLISLRRILADGVRPDLTLIEVLPAILTDSQTNPEIQRTPVDRLWRGELALMERYGAPAREWETLWWTDWPLPWYSHRFAIISKVAPGMLSWKMRHDFFHAMDASGWVNPPTPVPTAAQRRHATDFAKNEYGNTLKWIRTDGAACKALREILDILRENHLRAALVLMPEGTEFRSWYKPKDWQAIEDFLADLEKTYDVPLINAREWLDDDDFSDSHHMLPPGAAKFSKRLGEEAIIPLLVSSPRP